MTVAVAAKYPWGVLKELIPQGLVIPEAIILISDSRFSRKIPTGYDKLLDSGTKIFQLGNNVACVYAGVCELGEKCVDKLRFNLSRQGNPHSTDSRKIAQDTLNSVYRQEVARLGLNPSESPLYLLVGACNKQGMAELYRFSYSENFKPVWIHGCDILGWPETAARFRDLLSSKLKEDVESALSLRKKHPEIPIAQLCPMPIQDGNVALIMTALLGNVVEEGSDATIGGKIQAAMVTMEGVSYHGASYSRNPINPNPEWTRITADYANLVTVTGISGTIGVYHSSI
jgi:hypothetical protein